MSLPQDDLDFLDSYASIRQLPSRSAALRRAVSLLRASELDDAYAEAWDEWIESGEAGVWEVTGT